MATYGDHRATWFTLQNLRTQAEREIAAGDVELILVDNAPDSEDGAENRDFCGGTGGVVRYETFTDCLGTGHPRSHVFRVARGEWVLVVDPHVFLVDPPSNPDGTRGPGPIQKFLEWIRANPGRQAFVSGPLLTSGRRQIMATHMEPIWHKGKKGGQFGRWAVDVAWWKGQDRELPVAMHGLGLWAAPRSSWPGFLPETYGFGGIEGCIQERWRRATGGQTITLRDLPWIHLFGRARGVSFPYNGKESAAHNYILNFADLKGWRNVQEVFDFYGGRGELLKYPKVRALIERLGI